MNFGLELAGAQVPHGTVGRTAALGRAPGPFQSAVGRFDVALVAQENPYLAASVELEDVGLALPLDAPGVFT